jgi:hypothetical protein
MASKYFCYAPQVEGRPCPYAEGFPKPHLYWLPFSLPLQADIGSPLWYGTSPHGLLCLPCDLLCNHRKLCMGLPISVMKMAANTEAVCLTFCHRKTTNWAELPKLEYSKWMKQHLFLLSIFYTYRIHFYFTSYNYTLKYIYRVGIHELPCTIVISMGIFGMLETKIHFM